MNLAPTPHDVGQPMANTKVIQKSTQNLKIMLLAIQLLWGGQQSHLGLSYMYNSLYLYTFCVKSTK